MSKRPNIVIFNPDQWRSDVMGHNDNPAAVTPILDEAVKTDSVSFRSAFCQNTVCTPSRCSFMTGWYTHMLGHRTMYHMLRPHEPMLLRTLRRNGYFVWWGGKNDLIPGQNGWKDYCDIHYKPKEHVKPIWKIDRSSEWREPGPEDDRFYSFQVGKLETEGEDHYHDGDWANVMGAADFIRNAPTDKPLCIYLPLTYPHPPYAVEDPFYSMIDRSKLPPRTKAPDWDTAAKPSLLRRIHESQGLQNWTEDRWDELRATYYGMCARVDHQYGVILQALRDAGIYDDTAVFLFSDHGDFTGDYGLVEKTQNTFEDCLSRVPFVVKPPAWAKVQPRVSDALVELIDFPATVEALTGIEPEHDHFGISLLPVLAGETDEHRDAVFCEGGRRKGEEQCMEKQSTSDSNLHGLYYPRIRWQTQDDGPEHTKAVMCRTKDFKYVRRLYEKDELYDLRTDPGEEHNRIDDPALAAVLATLKERLLTFYQETADVVPQDTDQRNFS